MHFKIWPQCPPVCTLSPVCSSAILTNFPFSRETLAAAGKHLGVRFSQVQHSSPVFSPRDISLQSSPQTPQAHSLVAGCGSGGCLLGVVVGGGGGGGGLFRM